MNTDISNLPKETDDKKTPGKEHTDSVEERIKTSGPDDKPPVGPFEHSGEVAGWTAAEEKAEEEYQKEASDARIDE
jgi:hypothetical protein